MSKTNTRYPEGLLGANHCVVYALGHAANLTVPDLHRIASLARTTRSLVPVHPRGQKLLDGYGLAVFSQFDENQQQWADLAGLRLGEVERWPSEQGPTLAAFAREHKHGTWIVIHETHRRRGRHALAVVNGKVFGEFIQPRKRLVVARRVFISKRRAA